MAKAKKAAEKTEDAKCPVTRDEFRAGAKEIEVKIGDQTFMAEVKEFSTGSFGWFLQGKVSLPVGDTKVKTQIGLNLIIVGSKEV